MANYTELRQGDRLPTVGVLQKLLNRSGAALKVDGDFGQHTHDAVVEFQKKRGLKHDGIVAEETWTRLAHLDALPIVDCIDVFDPGLYEGDATNIMNAGGKPYLIGGMSKGVQQALLDLAAGPGNTFLLRFIGHGMSGFQGVSDGKGGWDEPKRRRDGSIVRKPDGTMKMEWHSFGDQYGSLHKLWGAVIPQSGLQNTFGPYGSVELHGCHVGKGMKGHEFVQALAGGLGVPVTAASGFGVKGYQTSTFRFDGPTFTALPAVQRLEDWSEALPDFSPMTIP